MRFLTIAAFVFVLLCVSKALPLGNLESNPVSQIAEKQTNQFGTNNSASSLVEASNVQAVAGPVDAVKNVPIAGSILGTAGSVV